MHKKHNPNIIMKKISLFLLSMLLCGSTQAIVRPASLFNDGMVLQQQSKVRVWGRAKALSKVSVKGSWNNKTVSCKSDAEGKWELHLQTPVGSYKNYKITMSDGQKLVIKNVLIGEVWFASGQSNMEMPLHGYYNCPVQNSSRYISESNKYNGKLRMVSIPRFPLRQLGEFVDAKWMDCTPQTARDFSATAYFFATQLADKLTCPVGIINNAWGGSSVEAWTPEEILETYPEIKLETELFKNPFCGTPMIMYNGMIHPLAGYNIRGFIWYQGESNVPHPEVYADRFSNMIKAWRKDWGQGDLPFLFVEIAPYKYGEGDLSAQLREAQCDVQNRVKNTWMVCTNDLVEEYEPYQIHPHKKFEVGERLSLLALNKVYNMNGLVVESPQYQNMEIKGDKIYLSFTNLQDGFNRFQDIQGFEIAGADKKFYPATAGIEGTRVVVSSQNVENPVAVRYCFHNFAIGNLKSGDNLPIIPFRTDK
jgi:sialate O-acetylesterase